LATFGIRDVHKVGIAQKPIKGGAVLFDYFGDSNWLSVIAAALAYRVLGAIWYSPPLFSEPVASFHGDRRV
jgi:hypothetical protein